VKVLCCVDETKGSWKVVEIMDKLFNCMRPEKVYLLHVQKIEGPSLLDDLIVSDSEMKTLKESIEGTVHKDLLDKKSKKVLDFYKSKLSEKGFTTVEAVVKSGHPAEEILNASEELAVDLIVMGTRGARLHGLMLGSVTREVVNNSKVSVLVAR